LAGHSFFDRQPAIQPPKLIITVLWHTKLWQHECRGTQKMASKKKIKRFQAVQAVKELARERMGAPPAAKVVPHKNKKAAKHKPTLGKLLDEGE
jgi:hypothetical protein